MHMYGMVVTLNMDLAMNSQNVFSNSLSFSFIKKKIILWVVRDGRKCCRKFFVRGG